MLLYSSEKTKNEVKETIPFLIATKIDKTFRNKYNQKSV